MLAKNLLFDRIVTWKSYTLRTTKWHTKWTPVLQLKDNPFHYDSHLQLIELLRQLGDLDRARQARHNMSNNFPLSEGIHLHTPHTSPSQLKQLTPLTPHTPHVFTHTLSHLTPLIHICTYLTHHTPSQSCGYSGYGMSFPCALYPRLLCNSGSFLRQLSKIISVSIIFNSDHQNTKFGCLKMLYTRRWFNIISPPHTHTSPHPPTHPTLTQLCLSGWNSPDSQWSTCH